MDAEARLPAGGVGESRCAAGAGPGRRRRAGEHDPLLRLLALRLALCGKGKEEYDFAAKRAALLQKHDGVQVHLLESIAAYFFAALQGRPEQAPSCSGSTSWPR